MASSSGGDSSGTTTSPPVAASDSKDPLAGCPFASLVRATGMAMPANHPTTTHASVNNTQKQQQQQQQEDADPTKGKCPMRSFGPADYAIVLIFAAVFLYFMPPAPELTTSMPRNAP